MLANWGCIIRWEGERRSLHRATGIGHGGQSPDFVHRAVSASAKCKAQGPSAEAKLFSRELDH